LRFDACHRELHLNEVESDGWFLLLEGAKLDLRDRCHCNSLNIVRMRHVWQNNKRRGSPGKEETRNVEATMRIQQPEQMFTEKKQTKNGVLP
jgi:hypothetical protein